MYSGAIIHASYPSRVGYVDQMRTLVGIWESVFSIRIVNRSKARPKTPKLHAVNKKDKRDLRSVALFVAPYHATTVVFICPPHDP